MTYSDSNARNHKLSFIRMRAGMHAFLSTMAANFENVAEDMRPGVFAADTVGGGAVLGSLYYYHTSNRYDLALDLGPTNRTNRFGIVFCLGAAGAGSSFDALFFVQGLTFKGVAFVPVGTYGYLSKTTAGLIVPNSGATSGFSDAFDPAKPIIVGNYMSNSQFFFHVPLVYS